MAVIGMVVCIDGMSSATREPLRSSSRTLLSATNATPNPAWAKALLSGQAVDQRYIGAFESGADQLACQRLTGALLAGYRRKANPGLASQQARWAIAASGKPMSGAATTSMAS